ncbi:hypothetical protein GCM10010218_45600 [Streptomyces mashuensis]|uniref:Uncharacterized protein n=1 Tax=Streptomyces mashuensis TaxID=33904 RepID=A0A919B5T0_9ACTN|nr:hypothetical protein GCM10010218_45600 [Streptomyces mashuensis]
MKARTAAPGSSARAAVSSSGSWWVKGGAVVRRSMAPVLPRRARTGDAPGRAGSALTVLAGSRTSSTGAGGQLINGEAWGNAPAPGARSGAPGAGGG